MAVQDVVKGLGPVEVIDQIRKAGLKDQGIYRYGIADEMDRIHAFAQEEGKACSVVCGLNNADTVGALLALLREMPERVLDGIAIAGYALETAEVTLYLPEEETTLAQSLQPLAKERGIAIAQDIINVRATETALRLHLTGAADIAALFAGTYAGGIYFAIDGQVRQYPEGTRLAEVVSLDGVKAVYTGYRYYGPEAAAGLTLEVALDGTAVCLGEDRCIVDETRQRVTAYRRKSCGRCVFCREGLIQLEYEQREITMNRGKAEYQELAQEIGENMCEETLCSLGQQAARCVMTAYAELGVEYTDHIKNHKCPANVCGAFSHIYIDPVACTGCGDCVDVCPKDCIEGKPRFIHMIDEFDCTKCGACIKACEEEAIIITSDKLPRLPDRLTKVGRFKKR